MTFEEAKSWCHVRSSIYRESKPEVKYGRNHDIPFEIRVPIVDQLANDWKEYDPRDDESSYCMFG